MCFQMSPQIAFLNGCIVTLVAFVWLFSTVSHQMSPQIAFHRRGIIALVAFVCLFSTVCFQMLPQIACMRRCIVALVAFVPTFLHCAFSNVASNGLHEKMHSCIGCIYISSGSHPSNQSYHFQYFVPLPLCAVLCSNGCLKLSPIND